MVKVLSHITLFVVYFLGFSYLITEDKVTWVTVTFAMLFVAMFSAHIVWLIDEAESIIGGK